jgi:hypothetical protein
LQEWLKGSSWATNVSRARPSNPLAGVAKGRAVREGLTPDAPFRDLPDDFDFEAAEMQVAACQVKDGRVVVEAGDMPLVVNAARGRGQITVLLFSPEREPLRSWKNLPTFWAKLVGVPGEWYVSNDFTQHGGWGSDGIFGALIDTKQVHKLPIGWLLLLLLVYLVVIGPLDHYWLKKIGRPMLTWVTFPCYVVTFSLVIYFLGYKLRAGESEWNELHVVDILQRGPGAELRGRTYASVYSPSNQKYPLQNEARYATLRGEFAGLWSGGQSSERLTVDQSGDSYKAEIFVPVWTSQLFVSDWWQPALLPASVTVKEEGSGWRVTAENRTETKFRQAQIVVAGRIIRLGDLAPGEKKDVVISRGQGMPLATFVGQHGAGFQMAVQSRRQAFGATQRGQITDLPNSAMAVSFLSQLAAGSHQYMNTFIAPPGLDLSPAVARGSAVFMAWAEDYSPLQRIYRFSPRRSQQHTLWRMTGEVKS